MFFYSRYYFPSSAVRSDNMIHTTLIIGSSPQSMIILFSFLIVCVSKCVRANLRSCRRACVHCMRACVPTRVRVSHVRVRPRVLFSQTSEAITRFRASEQTSADIGMPSSKTTGEHSSASTMPAL